MKSVFSADGLQAVQACIGRAPTLYAFDFDGTLAPIVTEPAAAVMPPQTAELLGQLAERLPLAIVSGRSLADLSARVNLKGAQLVGNHGMEGLAHADDSRARLRFEKTCLEWVESLGTSLVPLAGAFVENKGLSLAVHYREAADPEMARHAIAHTISKLNPPPRVIPGKALFNLLPDGAAHKGTALLELMSAGGFESAIFVGDDDTDEDVFRMHSPKILSIRVGPGEESAADYFMEQQPDIDRLLTFLLQIS